jgi:hypothetical protein
MTTCISRRACADRNTIRLINEKGQIGKHIWTEYRCPNVVSVEGIVCVGCATKVPKYKYQAQQKCDHGTVDGPYPSDSKLYGSPYYEREIKAGWLIAESDEIRAKAAVIQACMGRKKTVEQPLQVVEPIIAPLVTTEIPKVDPDVPKKKRAYNRKVPLKPKEPKEPDVETTKPEKKAGRPRKVLPVETAKPIENPLDPKLIEIIAPPLTITECIVVKVKKMRVEGKEYYYDSLSGKLYGVSVNGVGAYKGRYNAETEVLDTTFPDSDCE